VKVLFPAMISAGDIVDLHKEGFDYCLKSVHFKELLKKSFPPG
jgi:hypothetical protein